MEPRWTVYSHTHVASGRRYVGLTKKTMLARWNQHVYSAENRRLGSRSHFWAAIRKYAFSHEVLEVCLTLEAANAAEERWIGELGARDPERGFNLMKGGQHTPHPVKNPWDRPEYRVRMEATLSARAVGPWMDPESVARRSMIGKNVMSSLEVRAKISEKARISNSDPLVLKKISQALSGRTLSPEHVIKSSANFRGRKHGLSSRKKMSEALSGKKLSPGHVKKITERQTGKILSAETKAKIGDAHRGKKQSTERRAAQSKRQKGRVLPPDVYARIAASCKATRERKMLAR